MSDNTSSNLIFDDFSEDVTALKSLSPEHTPNHRVKLFHGNSNPALAKAISDSLKLPLGKAMVTTFANGEIREEIKESVRGARVFVIQPTCGRVNDSLMELLIMTDALKRASAYQVCAVIPYYGYAKQEKRLGREPITAKLVANLLTTAGVDRVITCDLHAAAIQGFFDIPVDNLSAIPIFLEYIKSKNINREDLVVVSPDAGGVTRATKLAEQLGAKLAIIFKRRPEPDKSTVIDLVGKVANKTCIIVDDMISTGGTLIEGVKALKRHGAKTVYAAVTHALFASSAVKLINKSALEELIVTDTIPISEEAKKMKKLKILSVANLFAQAIVRTQLYKPISPLFLK
ncbi:ribose-phosphate pyrophosphokinase [bacterium]|nr:ribose-phosphate pyrophosphokinase [bacterium]